MFLNWQQSKSATIVVVVFIFVSYAMIDEHTAVYRRSAYFSEIRSNLRIAADAQRSYFDKNNSYKSCVACTSKDLPGFHNSSKVTLNAETGRTGVVLTATHENCGSSVWTYQSTTEPITDPDHYAPCGTGFRNPVYLYLLLLQSLLPWSLAYCSNCLNSTNTSLINPLPLHPIVFPAKTTLKHLFRTLDA